MTPTISVVIPNWNGLRYLPACLESLQRQTLRSREVIVVDNGSTDDSCEWIARSHPEVHILRLDRNLGFPAAVNRGIEASRGEIVALLNNDTWCDRNWLAELNRGFKQFSIASFAASRILEMGGGDARSRKRRTTNPLPSSLAAAGDFCYANGIVMSRGKGEPANRYSEPEFVFGASACASAYRRECFDRVGLFDESFFFSFEDADWSFRAQLAGLRCVYLPNAVVHHLGCGSIFDISVHKMAIYHVHRNQAWFLIRNFPTPILRRYAGAILECQIRSVLSHVIRRNPGFPRMAMQGKLSVLLSLPRLLRSRRQVQLTRHVSIEYLQSILAPPPQYDSWTSRVSAVLRARRKERAQITPR